MIIMIITTTTTTIINYYTYNYIYIGYMEFSY